MFLGISWGYRGFVQRIRTYGAPKMPKKIPPLTDMRCRTAKPQPGRTTKLYDGAGLILEVRPTGAKLWRLKYRFGGKEKQLALGQFPERSLAEARKAAEAARRLVQDGTDPSEKRKADKQIQRLSSITTFEGVAREWHAKASAKWAKTHASKVLIRLEKHVFPWMGSRPISTIEAPEILVVLQRMEKTGILDTANRVSQYLVATFKHAILTGRVTRNVAMDLKGAIDTPVRNHYATITEPDQIAHLLVAINCYHGTLTTRTALALAPLLFCRPGELRGMRWDELDLEKATWTVPPARQKLRETTKQSNMNKDQVFPLSRQAVALLGDLKPLTGSGKFVFPNERSATRSMSENTVNAALRRLGYDKEQITGHGFRHMASTLLNEQGWTPDAIEKQLSHKGKDKIRATYNHAEYVPERRRMMQAWADYLDSLRDGLLRTRAGSPQYASTF
jgi:integrase